MIATDSETAEHRGAASLLERLEDEKTLEALHRLLDHADVLAFAAQAADGFVRRGDTIADSIGDSLKDVRKLAASAQPLASQLPDIAAAGGKMAKLANTPAFQNLAESGLLEKLGDPNTIESLKGILGHLELISFTITMVDGFIRRGNELVDNIGGMLADAKKGANVGLKEDDLIALRETGKGLLGAANQLHQAGALAELPKLLDTLVYLIKSGIFEPKILNVLVEVGQQATQSYLQTKDAKPTAMGPLALYKALKDPDVQRAVAFVMCMTKQYGKTFR